MSKEKLSKTMAYVLRHKPEAFNVELNGNGWVTVTALTHALNNKIGFPVTEEMVMNIVAEDTKQRYIVREGMIRAAQGHSFPIELGLEIVTPPVVLFHGTAQHMVTVILAEGLKSMSRQHVHLSEDIVTATAVGARHGKPVILQVNAVEASKAGTVFMQAENGVWLSSPISAEFIIELT